MSPDLQGLLTPPMRRLGRPLYAAQMWAWGQDIRHSEGNLLRRYGFVWGRDLPRNTGGSSEYSLALGAQVWKLWSFGLTLGDEQGALLLMRQGFAPRWLEALPDDRVGRPRELALGRPAANAAERDQLRRYLATLAQACAAYENWITAYTEPGYRQAVLRRSPQRVKLPCESLATGWQSLACACKSARSKDRAL
ncbi:MAG: hypothetical protein ACO1RX_17430 [Candidatus Sericytochromatia bacterium]